MLPDSVQITELVSSTWRKVTSQGDTVSGEEEGGHLKNILGGIVVLLKAHPVWTFSIVYSVLKQMRKAFLNRLPGNVVLEISLDKLQITETAMNPIAKQLMGGTLSTAEFVSLVESAAKDVRVKAILVRLGPGACVKGSARVGEVRSALAEYHRSTGRPVVAYCTSFGEATTGVTDYWLASACSHIVMPRCGAVNITSLSCMQMFLKGFFEKVGLAPEVTQRRKYKLAANAIMQKEFTEEHRQVMTDVLDEFTGIVVNDFAQRSQRDGEASWAAVLQDGPYSSEAAEATHLVDHVLYYDELVDTLLPDLTSVPAGKMAFRSLGNYAGHAKSPYKSSFFWRGGPAVAVVTLEGKILQGDSVSPSAGDAVIGSDEVCAHLRALHDSADAYKAVVLRIDSPGGSYIASDLIHREVKRIAAKLPVFVSMGNVAASGGYYIAMAGHRVFASKGTITGSIGVINGKVSWRDLLEKLGATFDEVLPEGNENSYYFHALQRYNDASQAKLEEYTDHIYEHFKSNVAIDRNMTPEHVERIAQGKIYFGNSALQEGLITDVGGWTDCLDAVAQHLGTDGRHDLQLVEYPAPISLLTLLRPAPIQNREDANKKRPLISVSTIGQLVGVFFPWYAKACSVASSMLQMNGALYAEETSWM